jgi:hypothetical protein
MSLNLHNCQIVCINLHTRTDKKRNINRLFKRRQTTFKFEHKYKHQHPYKGNMISHLETIDKYYQQYQIDSYCEHLLILEDDIKFQDSRKELTNLPKQWDILYLGGRVGQKFNNWNQHWVQMSSYDNHAYIINMTNHKVINDLIKKGNIYLNINSDEKWQNGDASYSNFMINYIHSNFKCYMMNPQLIVQGLDRSDIIDNNITKNPSDMSDTIHGYSIPNHHYEDDNYIMKFSDIQLLELPSISLITVINSPRQRDFMSLLLHNFNNLLYPTKKIEWNILEFVNDKDDGIDDMFPNIKNINYYRIINENNENDENDENDESDGSDENNGSDITLGEKINYLVKHSNHQYIVHFDIHHHYAVQNIDARIKCLLKYDYISCLGCSVYGCYNLDTNDSGLMIEDNYQLYLPSLAYKKKFWKNRKFGRYNDPHKLMNSFTKDRYAHLMALPYESVIYCLVDANLHNDKKYQSFNSTKLNYMNHWDEESQIIINLLKSKNKLNPFKLNLSEEELCELELESSDDDVAR